MIPLRTILIAFKASPRAALAALWASVRGLRVRARNIIYSAAHQRPEYYPLWTSVIEPEKIEAYCPAKSHGGSIPSVTAVIFQDLNRPMKLAARTAASIRAAFGDAAAIYCQVASAGDQRNFRSIAMGPDGEIRDDSIVVDPDGWLLPMIAGDEIAPHAGQVVSKSLACSPDAEIIYWDEDRLDGRNRHDPWLKPNWDELLFLARDYLTGAALFKAALLFDQISGNRNLPTTPAAFSQAVISLVCRTDGMFAPFHIPLILSHRRSESSFATAAERRSAIESIWHEPIELVEIDGIPEALRPRFTAVKCLPKVSILIPTRNRHDLLSTCLSGLCSLEYEGEVELLVIDNDSDDTASIEYLACLKRDGVIVIRHPGPFNFSAMNNRAASLATGELLCLLNNDIEMHDGAWLEAMVRHAIRPGIGAVGALLQYPDGTVQHAGVTIGTGQAAGHVYRGTPVVATGHRDMHRLTRHVSAVTAACLVVRREAYLEVGGLDETAFKVAFNDVDLCLKLSTNGYRNILAGDAHLTHHESKSRGSDFSTENHARYLDELAHLQNRWGTIDYVDPYHHPLAMRSSEMLVLAQ